MSETSWVPAWTEKMIVWADSPAGPEFILDYILFLLAFAFFLGYCVGRAVTSKFGKWPR